MVNKDNLKASVQLPVTITLLNYNSNMRDTYSQKFMVPLIKGILNQAQLAKHKDLPKS
jgi:hypothetical protein